MREYIKTNIHGGGNLPNLFGLTQKYTAILKGRKIGRNEPCPCGSGKKYKKCCIDKE